MYGSCVGFSFRAEGCFGFRVYRSCAGLPWGLTVFGVSGLGCIGAVYRVWVSGCKSGVLGLCCVTQDVHRKKHPSCVRFNHSSSDFRRHSLKCLALWLASVAGCSPRSENALLRPQVHRTCTLGAIIFRIGFSGVPYCS